MEALIPILLIVAGFLLILVEVYVIPGFNVVGILGFLLIVFAVGYFYSEMGWTGGTIALAGAMTFGVLFFWMLYRLGAWQRFVLSANLSKDRATVARLHDQRRRFLGQKGRAVTPLRPAGTAEVDGTRIEVTTEGEYIAAGSEVRVVAMKRRAHVVQLASDDNNR